MKHFYFPTLIILVSLFAVCCNGGAGEKEQYAGLISILQNEDL